MGGSGGGSGWLIHGDMVIGDSRLMVTGGKSHGSGYSSAPVILVVPQLVDTHSVRLHTAAPPILNHVSFLFSFPWPQAPAETKFGGYPLGPVYTHDSFQ